MITMSNFGRNGRLGNQLFQYAAMLGLARRSNQDLYLPYWKYAGYFNSFYALEDTTVTGWTKYKEPDFQYYPLPSDRHYDFNGYFQSRRYWENCISLIRDKLAFRPSFIDEVRAKNIPALSKPAIAVHVRRGDYVNNSNYYHLDANYYLQAYKEFLPHHNIIVFSDDIPYCKVAFAGINNIYYAGGNEIEDLCLMTLCSKFILSNSTFAWWGAYLSEVPANNILRPEKYFSGKLALTHDTVDYYPSGWQVLEEGKIDLTDVTFTIPVAYDHPDRLENLDLVVTYLRKYFDTNIIVGEWVFGDKYFVGNGRYQDMSFKLPYFHRTKMLNMMAKAATTPIIANWDADVLTSPFQILKAVEKIRNGVAMCYPYDGRFIRIRRGGISSIKRNLDVGDTTLLPNGYLVPTSGSVGGAVLFNKNAFITGGMENENFISFGAEDQERIHRFITLGYPVERVDGAIYHINHHVGTDSSTENPRFWDNHKEFTRISEMDKKQLLEEIATWIR